MTDVVTLAAVQQRWRTAEAVEELLRLLVGNTNPFAPPPGDRKLRLFACACVRRIWPLLAEEGSKKAVETAEWFAEGVSPAEDLTTGWVNAFEISQRDRVAHWAAAGSEAAMAAQCVAYESPCAAASGAAVRASLAAASGAALPASEEYKHNVRGAAMASEQAAQAALLRDVFGNPFAPAGFDPAWRTGDVPALARAAYGERLLPSGHLERDRLLVLSDALEEAGCDSPDVLGHLRSEGPHVRGCWALDLALGLGQGVGVPGGYARGRGRP